MKKVKVDLLVVGNLLVINNLRGGEGGGKIL